jgi:formate hydrogenlyase subunit 6/NADH:ubiquinone oxidoreductase subunit I
MAYSIIETCIGCTACVKACPVDAITGARGELHKIHAHICVDCGLCGYVCPVEAILDYEGQVATRFKKRVDSDRIAVVDPDLCTACDFCFDICPYDAIRYRKADNGFFSVASVDPSVCKGCDKLCVSVCMKEAIQLHPRAEAAGKAAAAPTA